MVANVTNMLPKCAVVGKAKEHDSVKEGLLFDSLGPGDVGIADRAYDNFPVLYRQTLRGVYFVIHEKDQTRYRTISRADEGDFPESVVADETVQLTGADTRKSYPVPLRRVTAMVEVKGTMREMVFYKNNFEWSAATVAALYKARWAVELLFKELKQTLQQ